MFKLEALFLNKPVVSLVSIRNGLKLHFLGRTEAMLLSNPHTITVHSIFAGLIFLCSGVNASFVRKGGSA